MLMVELSKLLTPVGIRGLDSGISSLDDLGERFYGKYMEVGWKLDGITGWVGTTGVEDQKPGFLEKLGFNSRFQFGPDISGLIGTACVF
ncbi:MAG: hypothetical protein HLUCCO16_07240 [Phormidium sp. OSCR]|nr:MAG: hypothetical protein HLUCCO16_07240 [Phormidium sp. OSCR]